MSFLEEPVRPSVAPPGWSTSPELAPPPAAPPPATFVDVAADAAVRWRMRAARIDNLIVYGGYLLLSLLLHWRLASVTSVVLPALVGAAYHFVFEARDGQTIGKRRYGIRVVAAAGGPASPRAVAIRSVLRIADSLPVCYLVGLISMVWTGPGRRQRIGDIVAGTIVVAIDGRAVSQGTPRWTLPAATVVALVVSALTVVGIAEAGRQPIDGLRGSPFTSQCQGSSAGTLTDC